MRIHRWIAMAAVATLLASAAAMAAAEDEVLFEEAFENELAEGWSWLRERPGDWRLTGDGALEMRSRPGLAETVTTVLQRPAPPLADGPLVFEVTVTFLQPLTEQYEQAGLAWYDGGEPVFKLVHELVDGAMLIIPGGDPTRERTVTLRLVVSEGSYEAQFREEGDEAFRTAATGDLPTGDDSHISLVTYHGPEDGEHWVRFRDFRVARVGQH